MWTTIGFMNFEKQHPGTGNLRFSRDGDPRQFWKTRESSKIIAEGQIVAEELAHCWLCQTDHAASEMFMHQPNHKLLRREGWCMECAKREGHYDAHMKEGA